MGNQNPETVRKAVRERYGAIAAEGKVTTDGCSALSCCGKSSISEAGISKLAGYSEEQLRLVPEGADMGLGCGNPVAIAGLKTGETVLDLGSGGGFDCFQAAEKVGETGRVIGVDMTPEMVSKARENGLRFPLNNVEFRLGEIEHLPVPDGSVDVILSNCVVNLSPDKAQVFRETFRVLRPGGRLSIADIVSTSPLPEELRNDLALLAGCIAGAATARELKGMLEKAGFQDVRIIPSEQSRKLMQQWMPEADLEKYIVSATIEAGKPTDAAETLVCGEAAGPIASKPLQGGGRMDARAIKKQVYANFQSGFHCAEALSKSLLEAFSTRPLPGVVRASSSFGGGIAGTTEELCGAFTGGVLVLGALLGREEGGDDLRACGALTKEFKKRFQEEFGSLTCRTLLEGFDDIQKPLRCSKLTASSAAILADMLEEQGLRQQEASSASCGSREKVPPGSCPFGAGC